MPIAIVLPPALGDISRTVGEGLAGAPNAE
jgi:hypothetical protein